MLLIYIAAVVIVLTVSSATNSLSARLIGRDYFGRTALHHSVGNGHVGCVVFLVAFGVNIWSLDRNQRESSIRDAERRAKRFQKSPQEMEVAGAKDMKLSLSRSCPSYLNFFALKPYWIQSKYS